MDVGRADKTVTDAKAEPLRHVDQLMSIASRGLPTMLSDSGLCSFDVDTTTGAPRGESVRYTLITLLGLLRSEQAGAPAPLPVAPLLARVAGHRRQMGVGDTALLLWILVRDGASSAAPTLAALRELVAAADTDDLIGLEVGWWLTAAAAAHAAGLPADDLVRSGFEVLLSRRGGHSPLVRHTGAGRRANFPNFATQIYSLLALAELTRHDLVDGASAWAIELADMLVHLRRDNGGWPWLYHADRGTVIEPFEVYSVHQDAMAPMAFLALSEATGRIEYARAALEGVSWCFGNNEIGQSLVTSDGNYVNRSLRRRGVAKRLNLYGNTVLAGPARTALRLDAGGLEINRTCRPYHLGWILEAWSGREQLVADAIGRQR